jgi:Killing trait
MDKHVSGAARGIADRDSCADHIQGRSREPMSDPKGTEPNQIFDLAAGLDTLALGVSPSESFAVLGAVMAQTLGMAMFNAVSAQQNASTIRSAAITMACTGLMSLPAAAPDQSPAGVSTPGSAKPALDQAAAKVRAEAASPAPDSPPPSQPTTVDARIADAVNQIQMAVLTQEVVLTSGAGKAYQSIAHSASIAVQDAADALRGISIIAATGSGVAMTRFLATGDAKYLLGITAAQDMVKVATEDFARISAAATEALKAFPSG